MTECITEYTDDTKKFTFVSRFVIQTENNKHMYRRSYRWMFCTKHLLDYAGELADWLLTPVEGLVDRNIVFYIDAATDSDGNFQNNAVVFYDLDLVEKNNLCYRCDTRRYLRKEILQTRRRREKGD